MIKQAMLLAAGEGKRMRPLTLKTPKPLLPVGGKPLITWWLERLAGQGFDRVVINTHHLGEQLPAALGEGEAWGLSLIYSPEPDLLETGGGVLQALPLLQAKPFLLINSDVWCTPLPQLQLQLEPGQLAKLLVVPNPEHNPGGDFYLNGRQQLTTRPGPEARSVTFAGISLLDPRAFSDSLLGCAYQQKPKPGEAFPLAPLLRLLIDRQLAAGHYHDQEWLDVGTPARLARLEEQLA